MNYDIEDTLDKDNVISTAISLMNEAYSFQAEDIQQGRDDEDFAGGDQFEDKDENRTQIVINTIHTFKSKIKKEIFDNPVWPKYSPKSNETDEDTAEAFQGMANDILNSSQALQVFEAAVDDALVCGRGFFKLVKEYESNETNNQVCRIEHLQDKFNVIIDNYEEDWRKRRFAVILRDIRRSEFKKLYPGMHPASFPKFYNDGRTEKDCVTIAEFYHKTLVPDELIEYRDEGNVIRYIKKSKVESNQWDTLEPRIMSRRDIHNEVITAYVLSNQDILDQTVLPGKYIPVFAIFGPRYRCDQIVYHQSFFHWSKPSMQMYNYYKSRTAEELQRAPLPSHMAFYEQIKGLESYWKQKNRVHLAALPINPITDENGQKRYDVQPMPIPNAQVPAGNLQASESTKADIHSTVGLQETAMGEQGSEKSGTAIINRSQNSIDNINDFVTKYKFTVENLGWALCDWIPEVNDNERVVEILGDRDNRDNIIINQAFEDKETGKTKLIDIKNAKMKLYVNVGNTPAQRRKENVEMLSELYKRMPPQMMMNTMDLFIENVDLTNRDEYKRRFEAMIPAEIRGDKEEMSRNELQQLNQQLNQQLQMSQAEIQQLKEIVNSDRVKAESQERIATIKERGSTQREIISSNTDLKKQQLDNKGELDQERVKNEGDINTMMVKHMLEQDRAMSEMSGMISQIMRQLPLNQGVN